MKMYIILFSYREVEGIKAKGNQKFKLGRFELAADLYSQAIDKCPLSAKKKLVLLYRLTKNMLYMLYVLVKTTVVQEQ